MGIDDERAKAYAELDAGWLQVEHERGGELMCSCGLRYQCPEYWQCPEQQPEHSMSEIRELQPEYRQARQLVEKYHSLHNGELREKKGEGWYYSTEASQLNNDLVREMGVLVPKLVRLIDDLETKNKERLTFSVLSGMRRVWADLNIAHWHVASAMENLPPTMPFVDIIRLMLKDYADKLASVRDALPDEDTAK